MLDVEEELMIAEMTNERLHKKVNGETVYLTENETKAIRADWKASIIVKAKRKLEEKQQKLDKNTAISKFMVLGIRKEEIEALLA